MADDVEAGLAVYIPPTLEGDVGVLLYIVVLRYLQQLLRNM
jgi:hypothetical protein